MGQYDFVPTLVSRFAGTSLFIYDILLTLDKEITHVWTARWTLPKILYLWVRYPGLAVQILACIISFFGMSNSFCHAYGIFNSTWLLVSAASVDALLVLRVLALVKGRRRLTVGLKAGYAVVYTVELALLVYYWYSAFMNSQSDWSENLGCIQTMATDGTTHLTLSAALVPIATAPVVILNITLFSVVLSTVLPAYRRDRDTGATRLLAALLRDGVMYFGITTCVTIFATISTLLLYNQPRASSMSLPWFLCIGPVAASRLFLNLRSTVAESIGVALASTNPPVQMETFSVVDIVP